MTKTQDKNPICRWHTVAAVALYVGATWAGLTACGAPTDANGAAASKGPTGSAAPVEPTSTTAQPPAGASPTTDGTSSTDPSATGGTTTPALGDVTSPDDETTTSLDDVVGADPGTLPDGVPITTQVARLTYSEYDRALSDLLNLDLTPSTLFPGEQATLNGYFARASLRITERLHNELVRVAEESAAALVANQAAYQQVLGCQPSEANCRDTFIGGFGLRVFRRPLTDAEFARYQGLFDSAGTLVGSGDAFADGVQLTVEAMLQSPHFLYRVERGKDSLDEHGTPLTDHEVATRLAFTLLGTTPDDELLAQASAGALSSTDQIIAQAERLVALPDVSERVVDFHDRWLELDALVGVSKDQTRYPQFTPELSAAMHAETLAFIEDVTLSGDGAIAQLLTAQHTYVNDQLAALYGIPGSFGSELQRIDLTDGVRGGLLTQGSFLSGHSSSSTITSPILRGIFVLRRLLCQEIPEPPANATQQEPPPSETPVVTTRDFFSWKTSMRACVGCHAIINPVGFAFEGYDAIGVARTMEGGAPIDSTGVALLSGKQIDFVDARDLSMRMAELPELHACYAKNWLRYAYGRIDTEEDLRTIGVIARGLAGEGYGVRQLLVDLTRGSAFSHLAVGE